MSAVGVTRAARTRMNRRGCGMMRLKRIRLIKSLRSGQAIICLVCAHLSARSRLHRSRLTGSQA